ncbi:MAG: YtxH domain-containing protein [Patescibacteria group bacterium]|nr:YtxH domain-containing protein [Patescibacteria group bacterium]
MKGSDFLKGALAGAIAGALAGILFAPKSGKETRADMAKYYVKIKDDVAEKIAEISDLTKESYEKIVAGVVASYEQAKKITAKDAAIIKRDLDKAYIKVREAMDQTKK